MNKDLEEEFGYENILKDFQRQSKGSQGPREGFDCVKSYIQSQE